MPLTDIRLDEIRARLAAHVTYPLADDPAWSDERRAEVARMAAAAPTDLLDLLTEIDRLWLIMKRISVLVEPLPLGATTYTLKEAALRTVERVRSILEAPDADA